MRIIENEQISPFDVDSTLVDHVAIATEDTIKIYDAVTGGFVMANPNKPMVRLLREAKSRGDFVIVWSRGGYRWASDVVRALGLETSVDLVISKPMAYFDDSAIEDWLPYRVFLDPKTIYKQQTKEK